MKKNEINKNESNKNNSLSTCSVRGSLRQCSTRGISLRSRRFTAVVLAAILFVSSLAGCASPFARPGSGRADLDVSAEGDTSEESGKTGKKYNVRFGYNLKDAGDAPQTQRVREGDRAAAPETPAVTGYIFCGWYLQDRMSVRYDFSEPVMKNLQLTGVWLDQNSMNDSDGDGLPDAFEVSIGTDPRNPDSDGDGLSDNLEITDLRLDPLAKDTDRDGTEDGGEDTDEDGLANLAELEYGTNPAFEDTDFDGLRDGAERELYRTDPLNPDTDDDTVSDGEEIRIGTDPLTPESSFTTTLEMETPTENHPVSIEVAAVTDAQGAGSLTVNELVTTDIPALSEGSIGYLAPGYEIMTDGSLESAVITFSYDPSLGAGNSSFDPVIYWYDEDESELVEVPGQVRSDGKITAEVTHFSSYILLDRGLRDILDQFTIPVDDLIQYLNPAADSNHDGLSDKSAQAINDGKILYGNTFLLAGVLDMYGDSDDWDDDGLKNGEEIEISVSLAGNIKLLIHSNPLLVDSDGDGIGDYEEVNTLCTSPLQYDRRSVAALRTLKSDGYSYAAYHKGFEDDVSLVFVDKRQEAKQCLINYLYDYAPQDSLEKNAQEIADYEAYKQSLTIISDFSNVMSMSKSVYKLYSSGTSLAKYESNYLESIDLKENMISDINRRDKNWINVLGSVKLMDLPEKTTQMVEDLGKGDLRQYIDSSTGMLSLLATAVSTYNDATKYQVYSLAAKFGDYSKAAEAITPGKKVESPAGTYLTVACDLAEDAEKIADIHATYGKISANLDAYTRYLELLDQITRYSEYDYVRDAARDLGKIVRDKGGDEFNRQLGMACMDSALGTLAYTVLDVAAKKNVYAAAAKMLLDIYGDTVGQLGKYNIYFAAMAAVSDGCRQQLDRYTRMYDQTFSYDLEYSSRVEDCLVQLAQSRIIGEKYFYEYVGQDTALSWLARNVDLPWSKSTKLTPKDYDRMFQEKAKTVYDCANRLHLKLSKNLPGFRDYYDDSVPEDPLKVKMTPAQVMKYAAGIYVLSSGVGAWETRLELKKDGTFTGYYYDMNMGESGVLDNGETYDATVYESSFSGRFSVGEPSEGCAYPLVLEEKDYEGTDGEIHFDSTDWGKTRYVTTSAGGLINGVSFTLYTPDTPASSLRYEPWTLYGGEQDYVIGVSYEEGGTQSYFCRIGSGSYSSWSMAYASFVSGRQYLSVYGLSFGSETAILTAMRDMDADGTPELILTNGYASRTERAAYIFTFQYGEVQYLGIGPSDAYIVDNPAYPGIFGKYENNWTYYRKHRWNIPTESVAEGSFDPPFTQITPNADLYRVFSEGPRKYLYAEAS